MCVIYYTHEKDMFSRLTLRFAGYLTKGDVRKLFYNLLVKKYGSIKKASEETGIERKTVYNLDEVKEVSFETKAKVLDAAYRADPLYTLEFLVRVLRRRAGEALFALIDYVKTEAIQCNDPEKLAYYLDFLDRVSEELGAPLREEVSVELNDVKRLLTLKSRSISPCRP